jgi:hypothetical protein
MSAPAVGKRKWAIHYADALRHLEKIASESAEIFRNPHTARSRAQLIVALAMATQAAVIAMSEIAEYQQPTEIEERICTLLGEIVSHLERSK